MLLAMRLASSIVTAFFLERRTSHKLLEGLQANGVNVDLRWYPGDVSVSYLYGSMLYPKAPLTAVLGYELHRLCIKVSAAGIHVANADCLAGLINDVRPTKVTAAQQDGQKRNPGHTPTPQITAHCFHRTQIY